ncbi:Armadillo-type fold [Phytophthora cactorum]|nr:Armadillo-type fold [Phytophthora cactorum]
MIVECGAIAPLVDLLKSDNAANKEQAAIALGRLAANDAVNRDQMKRHGAVGLLMAFLRTGNRQQKRRAETALQSIGKMMNQRRNDVVVEKTGTDQCFVDSICFAEDSDKTHFSCCVRAKLPMSTTYPNSSSQLNGKHEL